MSGISLRNLTPNIVDGSIGTGAFLPSTEERYSFFLAQGCYENTFLSGKELINDSSNEALKRNIEKIIVNTVNGYWYEPVEFVVGKQRVEPTLPLKNFFLSFFTDSRGYSYHYRRKRGDGLISNIHPSNISVAQREKFKNILPERNRKLVDSTASDNGGLTVSGIAHFNWRPLSWGANRVKTTRKLKIGLSGRTFEIAGAKSILTRVLIPVQAYENLRRNPRLVATAQSCRRFIDSSGIKVLALSNEFYSALFPYEVRDVESKLPGFYYKEVPNKDNRWLLYSMTFNGLALWRSSLDRLYREKLVPQLVRSVPQLARLLVSDEGGRIYHSLRAMYNDPKLFNIFAMDGVRAAHSTLKTDSSAASAAAKSQGIAYAKRIRDQLNQVDGAGRALKHTSAVIHNSLEALRKGEPAGI